MATPKERLNEDLKAAMKAGDGARKDAIRFILSAIKQVEIDTRTTLDEEETFKLLQKEAAKRRDSIVEYRKAGREDAVTKEEMELALLESYLPAQMSRADLEKEVAAVIAETGATSAKEMGAIMKVLMPRVKGKADGKLVNEVVGAMLKK